jgi:peptide/nickel transport system substrate-binding protein
MPGYNSANTGYAYDPEGAKKLLAEAGVGEISTELYAMNVDPNPRIAQSIQQDLAAVGIKAEIRSLAQAEVISAGGSGKAPMIWSGGMAWIADFPDPANFYYGIPAAPGPSRAAGTGRHCNKELDACATKPTPW